MAGRVKSHTAVSTALPSSPSDDRCPVCGTTRYLQKDMYFLISDCYHKICNGCVERRFSSGPAQCPIVGCGRTLRRNKFHRPTFADLQMEREVDIRKRVAEVFNRREDEFDSLLDYNNYLNDVEDITYNLINKIDMGETEAKMDAYKKAHMSNILDNLRLEAEHSSNEAARQAAEQEAARLRRQAALREEEQERREREEARLDLVNRLAAGDDAATIARESQQAILRKTRQRNAAFDRSVESMDGGKQFQIRGLKQRKQVEPEKPFDPFDTLPTEDREYYILQNDYQWDFLDKAKKDPKMVAGGYDIHEYYARALCDAFSGLGVFIGHEMTQKDSATAGIATQGAATVGGGDVDTRMADDVF